MKRITALIATTSLMLCVFLFASLAYAEGSLQLSPLRLSLSDLENITTLTVKNRGATSSLVQLEVLNWTQKNGVDIFEPTRDILVSPPVFTIAPGAEQVLRAVSRRKADNNKELTYRLFVREVQDQAKPADDNTIKVLLNISLPIFIQSDIKSLPKLVWSAKNISAQKFSLKLTNNGMQHIQVKSFQLIDTNGDKILQNTMHYVLPDSATEWILEGSLQSFKSPMTIQALTDNGELRETITLEKQ
ncbi:MAG: molecular chaperone [Bacteroidia bacterium]|nr:molecular chaperone [Methylotenera sp.]